MVKTKEVSNTILCMKLLELYINVNSFIPKTYVTTAYDYTSIQVHINYLGNKYQGIVRSSLKKLSYSRIVCRT